jgi:hypothetical protein
VFSVLRYLGESVNTAPSKNFGDRRIGKIIIGLVLFCLFSLCVGWAIVHQEYYLTSRIFTDPPRDRPSVSNIVGKWHLSEDSIKQLGILGYTVLSDEIEFRADGTFTATNFPRLLGYSDVVVVDFYSGTGRWKFDKMRFQPWSVQLYYDQIQSGRLQPGYYFLQGEAPPFKMYERGSSIAGTFAFEKE